MDKFKDNVPGYPGIYVTKAGKVRSNRSKRWLKPSIGSNSKRCGSYKYLRVNVKPDGKDHCTRTKVSRLVALAWVPNPKPNKYNVVMHLDNNPLNNYYKNLKWGNQAENNEQKRLDRRGNKYPDRLKLRIYRYKLRHPKVSFQYISAWFGVSSAKCRQICKGLDFSTRNLSSLL